MANLDHTATDRTPGRLQQIRETSHVISRLALTALAVAVCAFTRMAFAQAAPALHAAAGTRIENTATVKFHQGAVDGQRSAATAFLVDQLLDVAVAWQDSSPVLAPAGAVNRATLFKVSNTGNGTDAYNLTLTALPGAGADFAMLQCRLYLDSDANGLWTDADAAYVPGSNDPGLDAGKSTDVLAVCNYPDDAGDQRYARVQLKAASIRFSGKAGDFRDNPAGTGVDLVLGSNGNQDSDEGIYQTNAVDYTFDSTQKVVDSQGGNVARSGSTILYNLLVHAQGNATGRNLVVTDPMPEHTTYVPGTLVVDDVAVGDSASDGDAGDFNITAANAITVNLGDMAGTAPPHVIAFKVTID